MHGPDLAEHYTTLRHRPSDRRPVVVRVTRLRDSAPRPAVLLVHGFKGFMHWAFFPELARRLARAGLVAVAHNASHNGVSARPEEPAPRWDVLDDDEGFAANTHTRELDDVGLVREYVEGLPGVAPARIGVFGHSRGGGIALLHAAERGAGALALWAPIDDIDRVDAGTKAAWRASGALAVPNHRTGQVHRLGLAILDEVERREPRLQILARSRELAAPTLVIHGTADDAVPHAASQHITAALEGARLVTLDGANHAFGATHPLRSPLHAHMQAALDLTVAHFVDTLARPR